jgi:hypothetical protein
MPTNGQFVVGEIVSAADANQYFSKGNQNLLINGDFRVAQRGTSFVAGANNDDTYNLDQWTLLSDGNDIVDITQSTTAPSEGLFSIGLDVETINKKFGIIQFIEQRNIVGAIGQTVTLSFKARISGTSISNVKAAILSWSGTADTVTSDVVSAWGADGVTPTFATNWTAENVPANLGVTTTWTTYRVQGIIDTANVKNIAVFIWCDDTTTTLADFLYITDVQLEIGAVASPFERRLVSEELANCQRYFFRWTAATNNASVGIAASWTEGSAYGTLYFPVEMRIVPTSASVSSQTVWVYFKYLATAPTSTSFSISIAEASRTTIEFTGGWSTTIYAGFIRCNSATAWWQVSAEL